MSVEINDEQDVPLDHPSLERALLEAMRNAGVADSEVSVLLTDDRRMTELNTAYRDLPETTDVLSFAQDDSEPFPFGDVLGDIVVSIPTAQRQAEQAGHSLHEEVEFLLIHGLVHLLGHDHESEGWETWNRVLKEIRPDA
jgi:probable rRNA maturation factor